MAGRLRGKGPDSTTAVAFVAFNSSNQIWNTNTLSFENASSNNTTNYAITAMQQSTSAWYAGNEPAGAIYYVLALSPITFPMVIFWEDTLVLPDVISASSGGLPTVDASNNVHGVTNPVTLTSAYDAAKTAAAPGSQMDLVSAPNANATTSFATAVWAFGTRTLTGFGSLVASVAAAILKTPANLLGTNSDNSVQLPNPAPSGYGGGSGGGGNGAYPLNVLITDLVGNPIQGALVSASVNNTTPIQANPTGINGTTSFSLDGETWQFAVWVSGYRFTPANVLIPAVNNTTTFAITPNSIYVPPVVPQTPLPIATVFIGDNSPPDTEPLFRVAQGSTRKLGFQLNLASGAGWNTTSVVSIDLEWQPHYGTPQPPITAHSNDPEAAWSTGLVVVEVTPSDLTVAYGTMDCSMVITLSNGETVIEPIGNIFVIKRPGYPEP